MSGAASTIDDEHHPGAHQHARRAGQLAREPGDVRLAARHAAEEEADEAHRDAERHGRDGGDDEERQRRRRRGR